MRQRFKKVYVVDISKSLLETAAERVKAAGLEDLVEIIEHDVTEASVFDVLPAKGSVDLVTFSYSLSMIPDKLTVRPAMGLWAETRARADAHTRAAGTWHGYVFAEA